MINRARATIVCLLPMLFAVTADAATAILEPAADASLYEVPVGIAEPANSVGVHLFAGRILTGERRRALLRFNVASIPAGSTVTSVRLSLSVTNVPPGNVPAVNFSLFPVQSSWSEGSSDAGNPGGSGTEATAGDPTWTRRAFPATSWMTAGGDIGASASAVTAANALGRYQWGSSAALVSDVQSWVDIPSSNFGWALLADEAAAAPTARRFASRETTDANQRPQLVVEYTLGGPGPQPLVSSIPTLSMAGMLALLVLMITWGFRVLHNGR